jgi:Ni,Fe-hydrogenase III small subunit
MHVFATWKKLFFDRRVTVKAATFLDRSEEFEQIGVALKKKINVLGGGRALRIRAVDGGSTNAEEIELTALNNAYYDVERFGLSFVASPRHADILMVSGPITRNLAHAVKTTYEATPKPCIVIALGDGACTGGIWAGSYPVAGKLADIIPVDLEIPGDPPSPTAILRGVLKVVSQARTTHKPS